MLGKGFSIEIEEAEPMEQIAVEEYDKEYDQDFLKSVAIPYFTEIYEDLLKRDDFAENDCVSKTTFTEVDNTLVSYM